MPYAALANLDLQFCENILLLLYIIYSSLYSLYFEENPFDHIAMCDERRDEQLCIKCIAAGAKRKKESRSLAALLSLQ